MNDKRTVSTIDLALQKHDTPVGPLFVAVRHGRIKMLHPRHSDPVSGALHDFRSI